METRLRRYSFLMFAVTAICILSWTAVIRHTQLYDVSDEIQKSVKQLWNRNFNATMVRGNQFQNQSQFLEESFRGNQQTNLSDNPVQDNGTEQCIKRLPRALIIGSAKCGTGALVTFLGFHPNIVSCLYPVEPAFFQFYKYQKGLEWYRSIMPCSYSNQITIEKSPQYFPSYDCGLRIHEFDTNIKLILTVKDPVEKAVSLFVHRKSLKQIPRNISFEDYITDNRSESGLNISKHTYILHQGEYAKYMKLYLMIFNRSQIHIVDGQVLLEDPAQELSKVENFLGVPAYFSQGRFQFNEKKGNYCFLTEEGSLKCLGAQKGRRHPEISKSLLQKLRTYYRPWNVMFSEMVNMTFNWGY